MKGSTVAIVGGAALLGLVLMRRSDSGNPLKDLLDGFLGGGASAPPADPFKGLADAIQQAVAGVVGATAPKNTTQAVTDPKTNAAVAPVYGSVTQVGVYGGQTASPDLISAMKEYVDLGGVGRIPVGSSVVQLGGNYVVAPEYHSVSPGGGYGDMGGAANAAIYAYGF